MKAILALTLGAFLCGCAYTPQSASVYPYYQTQYEQSVRTGVVESVRNVTIANPESGVGAVTGAALGAVGGAQIGSGSGSDVAGILGALIGGLIGQQAEWQAAKRPAFEITVLLDNGEPRAITQEADEMFRPGERVRLLSNGYTTRVTH